MPLLACFLRAVNVGGRRTTNVELVAACQDAGFDDVVAYQAAGNLVLDPGTRSAEETAEDLESAFAASLGFATEVVVRSGADLRATLSSVPWHEEQVTAATGKPQVVLCRSQPDDGTAAAVLDLGTGQDLLRLSGRDLHWLPTAGTARAALDTRTLYDLLYPATARTIGTLDRLHTRFFRD